MSQPENRIGDSHFSKWIENSTPLDDDLEIVRLFAARTGGASGTPRLPGSISGACV
jgi:hypothetical protein